MSQLHLAMLDVCRRCGGTQRVRSAQHGVMKHCPACTGPAEPAVGTTRRTDPSTSHRAALDNAPRSGTQRARVLTYITAQGEQGATDFEVSKKTGIQRHVVAKRRGELEELGWVEGIQEERPTDTGSMAKVHRATQKAVVWGRSK